ncbi:glycosyltransferase family 39 protein [Isosphaeraceae bacterium EP7]
MTPSRCLFLLIAASGLARLAWAANLGLGNDEAYHYLYTVHPALSYFDHPPMLALVAAVGPLLGGGNASEIMLRLGFIVMFAGSTWLLARLASRAYGPWAGFYAALALNVSAYHTAAASTFVLPDGPLLFFWLLTLDRLAAALESPRTSLLPWAWVGLAWGGGMLSKYHAALLPMGTLLYILVEPSARSWLKRPGPYLAAALGLLLFSPVLIWNAEHGWASIAFQGGRAVGSLTPRPDMLAKAIGLQALYLFPWIFLPLCLALAGAVRCLKAGPSTDAESRLRKFLACLAVLPLGLFAAISCLKPVLPHWALVGFLSLFPAVGAAWAARSEARPARMRREVGLMAALPLVIVLAVLAHLRMGIFQSKGADESTSMGLVASSADPTLDMIGWDRVADELSRRGLLDDPETFLIASSWYRGGQLAYALRGRSNKPVLCYNQAPNSRGFGYWSRPEDYVGRDGIFMAINRRSTEPGYLDRWFRRIEPIGSFQISRRGSPVRTVDLYRCVGQKKPFPYAPADSDAPALASKPSATAPR